MCFKCLSEWHSGMSCEIYMRKHGYNTLANPKLKLCPKCFIKIEKSDGCNHMTCLGCGHEFCWICLTKYSKNHFAEWNIRGCPGLELDSIDDMNFYSFINYKLISPFIEISKRLFKTNERIFIFFLFLVPTLILSTIFAWYSSSFKLLSSKNKTLYIFCVIFFYPLFIVLLTFYSLYCITRFLRKVN
jgi:hypothetical protein